MPIITHIVLGVLQQMSHQPGVSDGVSSCQQRFLAQLLPAWLQVRGRFNFLNVSRYLGLSERTLRRQFSRAFDWLGFNRLSLAPVLASGRPQIIALDASFVPKSGKKTYGLDRFFNGCAGRAQKGLEISLVSLIDVQANCAYALSVRQTPPGAPLRPFRRPGSRRPGSRRPGSRRPGSRRPARAWTSIWST